ncbi:MAG: vWA domain-containing protein [Bacteroidota bacterium]
MDKPLKIILATAFISIGFLLPVNAQKPADEPPDTRILFIFDGSQSMAGVWESDKKINIARQMLISIIDSLEQLDNVKMALRVYGHQSPVPPQDCSDTKLEVPFGKNNAGRIRQELRFLNPKGTTPMANSLVAGGDDFPPDCDNCRNIIILITDGIEACDGDPCEASRELQRQGITLKPFVIGIGIDENFKESFECIGQFYNAADEEQFEEVLGVVITQALNSTTAQVNLLDINNNPTETNVNLTFYDQLSGRVRHNFIHTINTLGNPDTIALDPLTTYQMQVNTIPPVVVDSIRVYTGKHTIIAAKTPQGELIINSFGSTYYRDLKTLVKDPKTNTTLNIQAINEKTKYLVGKYNLEIPILPILTLENVEIKQSHTTTVEIPRPGIVNILKISEGFGSVYVLRGNKQEWVCNLREDVKGETLVLQPGNYKAVFRAKNAKHAYYTIQKSFEIKSGSSVTLQMY